MRLPIISAAQMREWERASWSAGRVESEVILHVARAVARQAEAMTQPGDRILILAGKGHNGDDARQSRRFFTDRVATVVDVTDPRRGLADFQETLKSGTSLIIDGLFGIGLNRPLEEPWIALIEGINGADLPVLAVDLPSGLNADTGEPEGAAIRAEVTLTVGAPKRGMIEPKSWPYVGRMEVAADVGLLPCPCASDLLWTHAADFKAYPRRRATAAHKGDFGHAVIFAGSLGYHGAAVIAAGAASRARPGLVSVYTPESSYVPVASQLRSVMVHPWAPDAARTLPPRASSVVIGPGLADPNLDSHFKEASVEMWRLSPLPVLADASALDWLKPGPPESSAPRVITPHLGEAARLLNGSPAEILKNRVEALHALSSKYGDCWVVLKGHQTMIGKTGSPVSVNSSGNAFLAQGGSGDALSGLLGGLLAQPALLDETGIAIRYGVWKHGQAADQLSKFGGAWVIDDLVRALGTC